MKYCSTLKKNAIMSFPAKWVRLEDMIIEGNQREKGNCHMPHTWRMKQRVA